MGRAVCAVMPSSRAARSITLVALTDEARAALGGRNEIRVTAFPFKVGRESRQGRLEILRTEIDRRLRGAPHLNDLYLLEPPSAPRLHISRAHFVIDRGDEGYELSDRESTCGTGVAGIRVGGDMPATAAELKDGDLIVVGTTQSPYVFRFQVAAKTP